MNLLNCQKTFKLNREKNKKKIKLCTYVIADHFNLTHLVLKDSLFKKILQVI